MRSFWLGVTALTATALTAAALAGCAPTFNNPIKDVANDPYVVKDGSHYLLIESAEDGIWVTASPEKNLTDIAQGVRTKVWTAPSDGPNCRDVWAPELHHIDTRWYVYYAATTCDEDNAGHRMFVLESAGDDPLGPYTDLGKITDAADRWAIDGTRFEFQDRAYFAWSGWPGTADGQQNLYIAEMTSPTTLAGTGVLISEPTLDFERHTMPINEGPQALVTEDRVFLVYSASASWTDDYAYGLLTGAGKDLLDPSAWTKSPGPVFERTGEVFGPGHGSFTTSPDGTESWMVYHSARYSGAGWDRVMNAQRFTWKDGAPVFGEPFGEGDQRVPSGQ
ncbi:glycoside hydrolase family 43 protein [Microbacterium sp. NEAU-LLC]|uniref:Glycoside hydrolase family 43 protein n=1 Tax=Microbacterium helvum TaxID=2773713 RepID=A0ABR8NMC9_9MICO|nr:glycoside hydrolase family 43 protein [Microbacterium helvum]MBD3941799.1 glycoside hydrolase family 43 protein [Microbacterium helvum]